MAEVSTPPATGRAGGPARSLADWLRGWDDADLRNLIRARPDLVLPAPADTSVLALRAGERTHVARALDHLDAFTLSLVDRILLDSAPISEESIATDASSRSAVETLRRLALVWGESELVPVSGLAAAVERPAGLGRPIATLMRLAHRPAVAAALAAHGIPRGADFDESAARLSRALVGAVELLPDDEREVLSHLDGNGSVGVVTAATTPAGPADPSPVRRLLARGLLLPLDEDTVEIPREVGLVLRGPNPIPDVRPQAPELTGEASRRPDADQESAMVAANSVRLVAALLGEWAARPPTEKKAGGLAQRDLKAAARLLDVDERSAALIVETARAAGLVGRTTTLDACFAPTPGYDDWLRDEVPTRWARLAWGWLDSPIAPSFQSREEGRDKAVAPLSGGTYHRLVRDLRRAALNALASGPAGLVPTRESLLERLAWLSPRLFRPQIAPLLHDVLREADLLGITAGGHLAHYAAPLLAGDEVGAAAALTTALPEPIEHVLLQADLTAVAPGRLRAALADDLALMADVESPGGATVYRFTDRTIRRALDVGWDAARIQEFLLEVGKTPVPQTLSYLVEDTARRHGRIRVGAAGGYLRCDDEALLAEVVNDRRCAPLRLRRIAPTVAVSPLGVGALLDSLRAAGYAPVGERGDGTVNLTRIEGVRAARPIPTPTGERPPDDRMIERVVAGLRAGDRVRRVDATSGLRERGLAASLELLEQAIAERRPVVLGYVNAQGRDSRRVVEPERVAGGLLTAYDHQTQERRSFALSRITELGLADEAGP